MNCYQYLNRWLKKAHYIHGKTTWIGLIYSLFMARSIWIGMRQMAQVVDKVLRILNPQMHQLIHALSSLHGLQSEYTVTSAQEKRLLNRQGSVKTRSQSHAQFLNINHNSVYHRTSHSSLHSYGRNSVYRQRDWDIFGNIVWDREFTGEAINVKVKMWCATK